MQTGLGPETDTWLGQAEAASRAGCSVSAVRKWRRLGVVADRVRMRAGTKLVEVRLEDVMARAEQTMPARTVPESPPRQEGPAPPPTSSEESRRPPGIEDHAEAAPLVSLSGLESLVARIVETERRAATAEAQLEANQVIARFLQDRLADAERELDKRDRAASRSGGSIPDSDSYPALQRLDGEMRALHRRLLGYRNAAAHGVAERELWRTERTAYDTALIAACVVAGLPNPAKLGDPLTPARRRALMNALNGAGFAPWSDSAAEPSA